LISEHPLLFRGASPLGLPYRRSREPLRRLAPIAWLAALRSLASSVAPAKRHPIRSGIYAFVSNRAITDEMMSPTTNAGSAVRIGHATSAIA